jgi:hypothetical protein
VTSHLKLAYPACLSSQIHPRPLKLVNHSSPQTSPLQTNFHKTRAPQNTTIFSKATAEQKLKKLHIFELFPFHTNTHMNNPSSIQQTLHAEVLIVNMNPNKYAYLIFLVLYIHIAASSEFSAILLKP